MTVAEDIYIFYALDVRLLKKGQVLTNELIEKLRLFGVDGVYIDDKSGIKTKKPLIGSGLRTKTINTVKNVFDSVSGQDGPSKQDIAGLKNFVSHVVSTLLIDKNVMVNISDLKSYDDYTYHHSLSVSILSIAIGMYLNLSPSELESLGFCSIMHDIGKVYVPIDIITKPSRLTDEEFATIKTHAALGGNYLFMHKLGTPEILESVISHHEKIDGTGYPRGLSGKDIPLFARIISVADVYDALTSNRPYRQPMLPAEAAEYIMGGSGTSFDYDIIKAFTNKIEFYPVGSFVELSNAKKYTVIDNKNTFRPVVQSISDKSEIIDLNADENALNLVVTKVYSGLLPKDV